MTIAREEVLRWLRDQPDILSDEEWEELHKKVDQALTPPPDIGWASNEEDPGATENG